ncbi:MAG: sulfur carrier protein ThiS [Deltaproteobacteria bacterium]|nr:sulfur carrier protein ThiS [Deltaproteobacteria bacterium]
MKITVNGTKETLSAPTDIDSFLQEKGIDRKGIVVELNREIIPQGDWPKTVIGENDSLEILRFMGGGAVAWRTH